MVASVAGKKDAAVSATPAEVVADPVELVVLAEAAHSVSDSYTWEAVSGWRATEDGLPVKVLSNAVNGVAPRGVEPIEGVLNTVTKAATPDPSGEGGLPGAGNETASTRGITSGRSDMKWTLGCSSHGEES